MGEESPYFAFVLAFAVACLPLILTEFAPTRTEQQNAQQNALSSERAFSSREAQNKSRKSGINSALQKWQSAVHVSHAFHHTLTTKTPHQNTVFPKIPPENDKTPTQNISCKLSQSLLQNIPRNRIQHPIQEVDRLRRG